VSIDPDTRRAALIATAVTVPIVLVAALLFGNAKDAGTKGPSASPTSGLALPAISVSAGPVPAADDAACTALLSALPVAIPTSNGSISGRPADSSSPYVVAWGNPAIVLRCGVPRPAELHVNSSAQVIAIDGVNFFTKTVGKATVFTSIDRAAYIEVTVPTSYTQAPIGPLAQAIASLPQVCTAVQAGSPEPATGTLCTHRK